MRFWKPKRTGENRHDNLEQVERDQRVADAEAVVADLTERAERVGPALKRRDKDNHWTLTFIKHARGEEA